MEEIEVIIKLSPKNQIYYISIRKSDTILKLKEYCQFLSKIPPDQQNLLYKGKILLNEKLISDYNIENNQDILLVKRGDPTPQNDQLNQNSNNLNLNKNCLNINNINFSIDKEINFNNISNFYSKIDLDSFLNNVDVNNLNNLCQSFGLGCFSELSEFEIQKAIKTLNDPSFREIFNNAMQDPSLIEMAFNDPVIQEKIKNIPSLNFGFQSLNILLIPHYFQMAQNMFSKKNQNQNENYGTEISKPPDPFENLHNNQINQMMNSSGQISNINNFNNNTGNKEKFGNNRINIDYKEKYKEQLSQLKNMGFINEENNIEALKISKGIIDDNVLDKLLKEKN